MKHISALELRKDLKVHTEQVRSTGEPSVLIVHGQQVVALVPVEWAEVIDQITQFDKCDADPDAMRADLNQVLERAFKEALTGPKLSLVELFKKFAEDATTVRQFYSLQESMKRLT